MLPEHSYVDQWLFLGVIRVSLSAEGAGGGEAARQTTLVVHLSPAHITALPAYRTWLQRFGSATKHLLVNAAAAKGATVMTSSATIQAKLNAIDASVFPLPSTCWDGADGAARQPAGSQPEGETVVPASNLLKYWLRPVARQGLDAGAQPRSQTYLAGMLRPVHQTPPL